MPDEVKSSTCVKNAMGKFYPKYAYAHIRWLMVALKSRLSTIMRKLEQNVRGHRLNILKHDRNIHTD